MEKILDAALEVIEIVIVSGVIGFGGLKGLQFLHHLVQRETMEALTTPTPSLSRFSKKLTQ